MGFHGRYDASRRPPRSGSRLRPAAVGAVLVAVAALALAACSAAAAGPEATATSAANTAPTNAAPTSAGHAVTAPALPKVGDPTTGDPAGTTAPAATGPADSETGTPDPPAPPPTLVVSPADKATGQSPIAPITATAADGTLTAVTLVNPAEKLTVAGAFNADHTAWHATEPLGYGKSYRLTATATGPDGQQTTDTSAFTTLTPGNQTMPYLDYIGGYPLAQGASYGVGIVPVVHFDEPITDRKAAQATLSVTTTPHVDGAWYWADDQNVHFRPKTFWPAGTKVTVAANVYGAQVSPNLYGQANQSVSFTIGRAQITNAYDSAPKVDKVIVTNGAGTVLRTMNTSMGKHGGVTVNGTYINFYTMAGTYTVLAHTNPEMMSSESYGLPADAPGGYKPEPIYYSTRISTDGIFLHQLESTTWAQNNGYDVSHGCLNLNHADAVWFYHHSLIGDPVIVHGAKGAPSINLWEGGDWSVPWATWTAGGAAS